MSTAVVYWNRIICIIPLALLLRLQNYNFNFLVKVTISNVVSHVSDNSTRTQIVCIVNLSEKIRVAREILPFEDAGIAVDRKGIQKVRAAVADM